MTTDAGQMSMPRGKDRVFLAIDTPDPARAAALVNAVGRDIGGVKLGKEFFTAAGPEGVRRIAAVGLPIFLDLKFHDIPNTVAGAVRSALALAPAMLTVHASGGRAMIAAARAAAGEAAIPPLVVAVTVLTSLDDDDLATVGQNGPAAAQVSRLAALAAASGADGVVASPREVADLRRERGAAFRLVVPGVRPAGDAAGDQKRVMTPEEAVRSGADYLVIGRPITGSPDPAAAARRIRHAVERADG